MDSDSEQPLDSNFAIKSWLISFAVGLFTFCLVKLWIRVKELPPGPMPLPFFGNLLKFFRVKSVKAVLFEFKKKYGGVYTLWMCDKPYVIVTDWELAREGLITRRNDIISRPNIRSANHMRDHFMGVAMEPNNKKWEVSRKVVAGAVRVFADSERLATIIRETTASFITKMLQCGKSVNPDVDIQELLIRIITETAFGSDNVNAEETKHLTSLYDMLKKYGANCPGDASTLLLLLYYNRDQIMKNMSIKFGEFLSQKFNNNKETFQRGKIRNFSDAVLTAGLEADEENKDSKEYLDDENMMKIIGVLYLAGTETSATTMRWMMLFLASFPDVQKKISEEIDENIGQRMPLSSDRQNCNYTWAFISESLRFIPAVPLGMPHMANVDTELGGIKIKKGTNVVFHTEAIHMDPEIWEEPNKFMPERFLDSEGKYLGEKKGFLAFGEGKRICVGEKLARNDLFLLLANLVQRVEIKPGEVWTDAIWEAEAPIHINVPKQHTISFKSRF